MFSTRHVRHFCHKSSIAYRKPMHEHNYFGFPLKQKKIFKSKHEIKKDKKRFFHLHIHTSVTTCSPPSLFPQTTTVTTLVVAIGPKELKGRKSHHRCHRLSFKIKLVKSVHSVNIPNKKCCKKICSNVKLDNLK